MIADIRCEILPTVEVTKASASDLKQLEIILPQLFEHLQKKNKTVCLLLFSYPYANSLEFIHITMHETNFNWICPYCSHAQTVTDQQFDDRTIIIDHRLSVHGSIMVRIKSIRCANNDCRQLLLGIELYTARSPQYVHEQWVKKELILSRIILPESPAKPQPSYIPNPIIENYKEACLIRDLSPKASATLSRRCLQGMIRDFCKIKDSTLLGEINTLTTRVNNGDGPRDVLQDTVEAIDAVRKIGNIGAHMEKDINIIIDVEPIEAQKLIELIELLFREWYVQRHNRSQSVEQLSRIADDKQEKRKK